jgi:hypothetical protein
MVFILRPEGRPNRNTHNLQTHIPRFPIHVPFTYSPPNQQARDIPSNSTYDRPLSVRKSNTPTQSTGRERDPRIIKRDPFSLAEECRSTATTELTAPSRPNWKADKGKTVQALEAMTEQRLTGTGGKGESKTNTNEGEAVRNPPEAVDYPYRAW